MSAPCLAASKSRSSANRLYITSRVLSLTSDGSRLLAMSTKLFSCSSSVSMLFVTRASCSPAAMASEIKWDQEMSKGFLATPIERVNSIELHDCELDCLWLDDYLYIILYLYNLFPTLLSFCVGSRTFKTWASFASQCTVRCKGYRMCKSKSFQSGHLA